jgi:hypothetical protein
MEGSSRALCSPVRVAHTWPLQRTPTCQPRTPPKPTPCRLAPSEGRAAGARAACRCRCLPAVGRNPTISARLQRRWASPYDPLILLSPFRASAKPLDAHSPSDDDARSSRPLPVRSCPSLIGVGTFKSKPKKNLNRAEPNRTELSVFSVFGFGFGFRLWTRYEHVTARIT